jgi:hypothetical protein
MPRDQYEALKARCQAWREWGVDSDKLTIDDDDDNDDAVHAGDPQGDRLLSRQESMRTPMYYVVRAPPYLWHTSCIFLKQNARGNLLLESVSVFFPRSAFCQRFVMQTSIGQTQNIPIFSQYVLKLTLSHMI